MSRAPNPGKLFRESDSRRDPLWALLFLAFAGCYVWMIYPIQKLNIYAERDFFRAARLAGGQYWPLSGPEMTGGGRLSGPAFYYLAAIPLLFSRTLTAAFVFKLLLLFLGIGIFGYLLLRTAGPVAAFAWLATSISLRSFRLENFELWNPSYLLVFLAALFWLIQRGQETGKTGFHGGQGFLAGILVQLHGTAWGILAAVFFFHTLQRTGRRGWLALLFGLAASFVFLLPGLAAFKGSASDTQYLPIPYLRQLLVGSDLTKLLTVATGQLLILWITFFCLHKWRRESALAGFSYLATICTIPNALFGMITITVLPRYFYLHAACLLFFLFWSSVRAGKIWIPLGITVFTFAFYLRGTGTSATARVRIERQGWLPVESLSEIREIASSLRRHGCWSPEETRAHIYFHPLAGFSPENGLVSVLRELPETCAAPGADGVIVLPVGYDASRIYSDPDLDASARAIWKTDVIRTELEPLDKYGKSLLYYWTAHGALTLGNFGLGYEELESLPGIDQAASLLGDKPTATELEDRRLRFLWRSWRNTGGNCTNVVDVSYDPETGARGGLRVKLSSRRWAAALYPVLPFSSAVLIQPELSISCRFEDHRYEIVGHIGSPFGETLFSRFPRAPLEREFSLPCAPAEVRSISFSARSESMVQREISVPKLSLTFDASARRKFFGK